jgi:hypothetical protein
MSTTTLYLPHPPADCWRALTDATQLIAWLPGLRRATVVATDGNGLASEVLFEYAESRTYTLLYHYDHEKLEMFWVPRVGKRDAVSGSARLIPEEAGTRIEYTLEQGDSRRPEDIALGAPDAILAAFQSWLARRKPSR